MIGGLPRLRTVNVEGPYNVKGVSSTPSRERLFVCRPATAAEEPACAAKILTNLARRAYRRPVTARRRRGADGVLQAGARERRRLRRRHPRGRRAHPVEPVVPVPNREAIRPALAPGAAHAVSDLELASRLSFFLWSSIPDEKLLDLAAAGRLREPGVLGRAGAPDDRGRARRCAGQQFRRAVAAAAQPRSEGRSGPADVPRFRRQHPEGVPPRDRDVVRVHHAREPQRAGAAERRLHVRQRAAGQALRHSWRLRHALPPGEADRSEPARSAGPGQHPVADGCGDAEPRRCFAASSF